MAVSILPLKGGGASLEYARADAERVGAAIKALYGTPSIEWAAVFATVRFGGCRFVYQDEWDDPCLIAGCPSGVRLLEAIARHCRENGDPAAGDD